MQMMTLSGGVAEPPIDMELIRSLDWLVSECCVTISSWLSRVNRLIV